MFLATMFEAITQSKTKEQNKRQKGSRTGVGSKIIDDDFFPSRTGDRIPSNTRMRIYRTCSGGKTNQQGLLMHDPST